MGIENTLRFDDHSERCSVSQERREEVGPKKGWNQIKTGEVCDGKKKKKKKRR